MRQPKSVLLSVQYTELRIVCFYLFNIWRLQTLLCLHTQDIPTYPTYIWDYQIIFLNDHSLACGLLFSTFKNSPSSTDLNSNSSYQWRSVVSDSSRPHGLQPTRLLHPWDSPGKSIGKGCHCLLQMSRFQLLQLDLKETFHLCLPLMLHVWILYFRGTQSMLKFFPSVQYSHSVMFDSLWAHGLQHSRLPSPSPTLGACSNSHPSSRWYDPTISSSVVPSASCLQSFPASGSFLMSQFFTSGGQIFGVLSSASVLPMNIENWFPLGWTGWISLQPKGLSRVFSNTTVQKHQFFGTQLCLSSNSHIHTWPLEKP